MNGLAFCAIIHHYRPHLIDFNSLNKDNAEENLKIAFEAASKLGITPLLTVEDMLMNPEKFLIVTYLFELRYFFEAQIEGLFFFFHKSI